MVSIPGSITQAWYEAQKRSDQRQTQQQSILTEVKRIREKHPKVGAQKLYFQLRSWCEQNGLKIGRDKFLNLLRTNGLMIYRRARKAVTTNSKHDFYRYPNLVKGIKVTGPNQLWPGRRGGERYNLFALTQRICLPQSDYRCLFTKNCRLGGAGDSAN